MKTSDEHLQEGIAAYKRGQKQEASRFFKQAIQLNPKNEKAWLWLSGVVESDEQRRVCLKRALAINPNGKAARQGLQKLTAELPNPAPTGIVAELPTLSEPISPSPDESAPTEELAGGFLPQFEGQEAGEDLAPSEEKQAKKRRRPLRLVAILGLAALIIALAVLALNIPTLFAYLNLDNSMPPLAEDLAPKAESAIVSVVYENLAAANAENIDRYMSTIHSQSSAFMVTRKKLETAYQAYDLTANIRGVEVIRYSPTEAWVSFILETRKQSGSAFRDNKKYGIFILRPENGEWKLYDQIVRRIQYYEYVEE